MNIDPNKISINSIKLGMNREQVERVHGKTKVIWRGERSIVYTFDKDGDSPDVRFRIRETSKASIHYVEGHCLEIDGETLQSEHRPNEMLHSRLGELLRAQLGPPDRILETTELCGEYWLYHSLKLQVSLSPGNRPEFILDDDFYIPGFALHESEIDEYEYNTAQGLSSNWIPNPRSPILPNDGDEMADWP